jgi:hypothetical protein
MATTAQNRNVVVVGIERASNAYGWLLLEHSPNKKSQRLLCFANGRVCRILHYLRRDSGGEFFKEIVGSLLRHAVNEALSELRELAADLSFDIVGQ